MSFFSIKNNLNISNHFNKKIIICTYIQNKKKNQVKYVTPHCKKEKKLLGGGKTKQQLLANRPDPSCTKAVTAEAPSCVSHKNGLTITLLHILHHVKLLHK